MKLTPLDIHHKEFGHALRGYNEAEVDAFLDQVADELERLFKENIDLSEKIEGLEEKVRSYQDMERTLHNTLLSAQKSADEMMTKSQREAEAVLKDAEVKAKEVIHAALTNKQKATADLGRIKQAEEEFRASFKRLLDQHMRSLAAIPVPEDVTLMMAQAGDQTVMDAVVENEVPASYAESVEAAMEPEPAPDAAAGEPEPGVVASLQLGDLSEPVIEDDTMEFNVAEFGFGEREDDVDIEEID